MAVYLIQDIQEQTIQDSEKCHPEKKVVEQLYQLVKMLVQILTSHVFFHLMTEAYHIPSVLQVRYCHRFSDQVGHESMYSSS
jgi:hypothetical protein